MSLASAIRGGDVAELPGKRDEAWRWTDLRGLLRALPAPSAEIAGGVGQGPFDGVAQATLTVLNGRTDHPVLKVTENAQAVAALRFVSRGDGAHACDFLVEVAAGAKLTLLESYEGEGAYVAQATITFLVGENASVERIVIASDTADAVLVSEAQVKLGAHADFRQTVITDGARRQRLETGVRHPGGGGVVRIDGIYLVGDKRHADLTTEVAHEGLEGETSQLTKGMVRDQGRAVFQGKIVVAEGADHTDARMGHHALLLSDRAEVDAKPELEIYADDVSCSHGNTVGALDEDALFYAMQRGIPELQARAMLTEAFLGEVVDRIDHEGAREVVRAWVSRRLEA